MLPVVGCLASLYLVTPLSGRPGQQYLLALILIGIGIVLFFTTLGLNLIADRFVRRVRQAY